MKFGAELRPSIPQVKLSTFLKPFLILCVVLIAAACVPSTKTQPTTDPAPSAERLAQIVQSFVDRDEIVSGELLVMHRGEPVHHRAFGFNDREARRPMTTNTAFAVRSMSKSFTGMAAQMLVEEGKLELDAPLAKYLPSFDNDRSRSVTIRHLLTHRSGFPFVRNLGKPLGAHTGGLRELADMAGEQGPDFAPGSRFVYSDVGSDILGAVIARGSRSNPWNNSFATVW